MAASLGKVLVIGATGQTGSKMICELLDADQPRASKVVAYGNTRMPAYGGRNAALFTAMQARTPHGTSGSSMTSNTTDAQQLRRLRTVASLLPRGSLSSAKRPQAPMEKLAGERGEELHGFDAIFIHVGTQR